MAPATDTSWDCGELLVSRTDRRGVIQFANATFQRIAGFTTEELVNAPHKIVRHQDMPRGVFWLLWHNLLQDKPIGAFVKNKTKSGGYYWVFAVVAPLRDGFISMRITPSPAMIRTVEPLYAKIREMEASSQMEPAESAEVLLENLKEMGFPDYEAFMARMLAAELATRDTTRDIQPDRNVTNLLDVVDNWRGVGQECDRVFEVYQTFGPTPSNMRVQASQLREKGVALSVISSNFAEIANQINEGLGEFAAAGDHVTGSIYNSLFLSGVTRLLHETEEALREEGGVDDQELEIIADQQKVFEEKSLSNLREVVARLRKFMTQTELIKRELSGLSTTRVMCAIENAKINQTGGNSVASIINDLQGFQNTADDSLLAIRGRLATINRNIKNSLRA
ncbi:PAS domain-containing protein [Amaricoccus tamworthensis]|uniref:PAS domain-containing protein n=1 Tax=Amaricoccus tamworthensis TaxID=57002 RepID=UPI003C7E913B